MVELEQTTNALAALDRPSTRGSVAVDELVADALVVPLVVEMDQILIDNAAQVAFTKQDHPA